VRGTLGRWDCSAQGLPSPRPLKYPHELLPDFVDVDVAVDVDDAKKLTSTSTFTSTSTKFQLYSWGYFSPGPLPKRERVTVYRALRECGGWRFDYSNPRGEVRLRGLLSESG
jgi:hypothetical protein